MRHAETLWNRQNRLQGHSDLPLSPEGHAQARRLGGWFAQRRLGRLLSSGLQRSRQTASAILAGNGHRLAPQIDEDLAEMHLGAWEGLTPEEIDARFGGGYRQWRERPSSVVIPEAEPLEAFRTRVRRAMERFAQSPGEGEQVVVTHGGVIAMMLAEVLGADYDAVLRRVRLDNAGVTALEFWDGRASVLWVNATEHLSLPAAGLP